MRECTDLIPDNGMQDMSSICVTTGASSIIVPLPTAREQVT